ncbi:sensor histidine kinase [Promicromonospora aerolata]|uniref:histidine kinase n=1 Tax=Promicromonospora aerolata TaxID=195749 RepID=A0ABW4VC05_9MICO
MGWYERWAQWSERYRFLVDLLGTLLLGLFTVSLAAEIYMPYSLSQVQLALASAAVLLPLPWCRTRPVASCIAVFTACMLHITVLGVPVVLPTDLVVLASMYCVTVYGPRWSHLMAGGMAVVGSAAVAISMLLKSDWQTPLGVVPVGIMILVLLACSFAFGMVRRSRRAMLLAMRDRAVRLEIERDQQAQIATAAERSRIAREMHDIVAHSLSVVIAQADGGRYAAAADPAAAQRSLGTIAETGRAALADMRRLLGVLREDEPSTTTPLGLVGPAQAPARLLRSSPAASAGPGPAHAAAGQWDPAQGAGAPPTPPAAAAPLRPQPDAADIGGLVEQARDDGLQVSWARVGAERRLPPGVGLTLFRVCQESLTNVRKHAGPRPKVTVLLRWGEDEVELRVDDDGRGLAAAGTAGSDEPVPAAGYGLLGMRERAEMFGGKLTAGPRRGGGFSVRFVVPIPRAPEDLTEPEPDAGPASPSGDSADTAPSADGTAPADARTDQQNQQNHQDEEQEAR